METILQLNKAYLQELIESSIKKAISGISLPKQEPLPYRIDKNTVIQMTGKSNQWVYQKTTKGSKDPLPFQKFGRQLVFSRIAIQEFIDSHTLSTPSTEKVMTDKLQESAKKKLQ